MFLILILLFIGLPILEIALLLKVGAAFGVFNTLAFVIFTAVLGAYLVRQQGISTLVKVRQETEAGRMPAVEMAEGVLLLIAGAVLLTPGFVTDAMGFALLIPVVRRSLIRALARHSVLHGVQAGGGANGFVFRSYHSRADRQSGSSPKNSSARAAPFSAAADGAKSASEPASAAKPAQGVIIEGRYRDSE